MRAFFLLGFFGAVVSLQAQSLIGAWRVRSGPSCNTTTGLFTRVPSATENNAVYALQFENDQSGYEGLIREDKDKLVKTRKFLYRQEGDNLFILDPRIRLIEGTYLIIGISTDSLVLVNPRKDCEQFTFTRIK